MDDMQLKVFVDPKVAVREGMTRSGYGVIDMSAVLPLLTADERAGVADALVQVPMVETFGIGAGGGACVYEMTGVGCARAALTLAGANITPESAVAAVRKRLADLRAHATATTGPAN